MYFYLVVYNSPITRRRVIRLMRDHPALQLFSGKGRKWNELARIEPDVSV